VFDGESNDFLNLHENWYTTNPRESNTPILFSYLIFFINSLFRKDQIGYLPAYQKKVYKLF
jgi:hypothetical protein